MGTLLKSGTVQSGGLKADHTVPSNTRHKETHQLHFI